MARTLEATDVFGSHDEGIRCDYLDLEALDSFEETPVHVAWTWVDHATVNARNGAAGRRRANTTTRSRQSPHPCRHTE